MTEPTIRLASPNDALEIAKIHVKTWQCAYRGQMPDNFLDTLSIQKRFLVWQKALENPQKGLYIFVAEIGEKVVGWCTGGSSRDDDVTKEIGELHGIYVDPQFIGKGVGSALMKQLLAVLKKDGFTKATLWVLDSNEKTRRFYEKKGWHVEGKTKVEPRDGFSLHETRYMIDL